MTEVSEEHFAWFKTGLRKQHAMQAWKAWIDLGPVLYMWYCEPLNFASRPGTANRPPLLFPPAIVG
jgi:hypothetical protein